MPARNACSLKILILDNFQLRQALELKKLRKIEASFFQQS